VRLRNTLILVAVLVLLGAFVYFVEIRGQKTPPEEPSFMEFSISDVARFQVGARGGPRMVATRRGTAMWSMEEPYQAEGDFARLEGVLVRLSSAKPRRVLTERVASSASFGLDDPWLTVDVELQDGSVQSLEVGDRTPNQASYYTRRGGEQTVLLMESGVPDQLSSLVTTPPEKPTPVPTLPPAETPTPAGE
jgi:hypothetical protein